jgi:hypothetical protein
MRAAREHRGGQRSVTATLPLRFLQRARPPRAPLSEIAQKTVAGATGAGLGTRSPRRPAPEVFVVTSEPHGWITGTITR